jgi:hypothetical protein
VSVGRRIVWYGMVRWEGIRYGRVEQGVVWCVASEHDQTKNRISNNLGQRRMA